MKGIYLIIVFVVVSLVVNRIASLFLVSEKETREARIMEDAMKIGKMLLSKDCLGYGEKARLEGKEYELAYHNVIDVNKLNAMKASYYDKEPECAISYEYGYRVKVEKIPLSLNIYSETQATGGVTKKVLEKIDGKKGHLSPGYFRLDDRG